MHHSAYTRPWLIQHLRLFALGLTTGAVAVLFRRALEDTVHVRPWLMNKVGAGPLGLFASIAFSIVTILPAVWLVARWCPEAAGSGIPQAKALARHPGPIRWFRLLLVKFSSGVLGIGGGLALGREGPTVQMGAALGEMFSTAGHVSPGERRQLLILGAGAGLAGAFNAPLAGALFVFEELGEDFRPSTCLTALLTTLGADLMCRSMTSQSPQLGVYSLDPPTMSLLPAFLLVGWLGGVLGVLFNRSLLGSLCLARWLRERGVAWLLPLLVAVVVGVFGWLQTKWVGGGHLLLDDLNRGRIDPNLVLVVLTIRFILTITGYATGAAGGLFAPLLVIGALMGYSAGQVMPGVEQSALVIAGMAALFTGIVRAPLTGVLLMIEMAGAYSLVAQLIAACLMAKLIADALGDRPIYEALLEQQARHCGQRASAGVKSS